MSVVAVYDGAGAELIVARFFAVETLADAAIVFLALLVIFSVFEKNARLGAVNRPIVAVIGVEMALVEAELRQKHRIARQLIEVIEKSYRLLVNHHEHVEIRGLVRQLHCSRFGGAEIVGAWSKRVPHHSVTVR